MTYKEFQTGDVLTASDMNRIGADTDWISDGFTAASGFSFIGADIRAVGDLVILRFANFTRTGAPINVNTTGDIANTDVFTVPAEFAPAKTYGGLNSAQTGRLLAGGITGETGVVHIAAAGGTVAIATGEALSLSGCWFRN